MQNSISETLLPNGKKIFCLKADEVPVVYRQIQEGYQLNTGHFAASGF